jgi:pyruvate formate lyase activating enzyme
VIKQVILSSTIDWPDELCSVLFLGDCNLKCEYCHNKELSNLPDMNFDEICKTLVMRQSFIDHVIISGGEPTICPEFEMIVNRLFDLGFKVGIHTNGFNFAPFEEVKDKISFVGLDIKCVPIKYYLYSKELMSWDCETVSYLKYLSAYNTQYEIRTTLDKYINEIDLLWIANNYLKLNNINHWVLQYEWQDGKRLLHRDKYWYQDMLDELNHIIDVVIR